VLSALISDMLYKPSDYLFHSIYKPSVFYFRRPLSLDIPQDQPGLPELFSTENTARNVTRGVLDGAGEELRELAGSEADACQAVALAAGRLRAQS
jgi:hypothetical protein